MSREPWRASRLLIVAIAFTVGVVVGAVVVPSRAEDGQASVATTSPTTHGSASNGPSATAPDDGDVTGRNERTIDRVRFSFEASSGWGSFGSRYPHFIAKDAAGSQDADAVLFWTRFGSSDHSFPCGRNLSGDRGPSVDGFMEAAASAPGIDVVQGPAAVRVGGRAASHEALGVRSSLGCDPGFFFVWPWVPGGAFWADSRVDDTIELWAVDVGGGPFIIESEMRPVGGSTLIEEIHQIVDSIEFE